MFISTHNIHKTYLVHKKTIIIIYSKTHTKSLLSCFLEKDFLRKNICCNMVLPILSKNRPIFVSRLKLTSPIKNCILSKGDNSKKARPGNRSVVEANDYVRHFYC